MLCYAAAAADTAASAAVGCVAHIRKCVSVTERHILLPAPMLAAPGNAFQFLNE